MRGTANHFIPWLLIATGSAMERYSRCPVMLLVYMVLWLAQCAAASMGQFLIQIAPASGSLSVKSGFCERVEQNLTYLLSKEEMLERERLGSTWEFPIAVDYHVKDHHVAGVKLLPDDRELADAWQNESLKWAPHLQLFDHNAVVVPGKMGPDESDGQVLYLNTTVMICGDFLGRTELNIKYWRKNPVKSGWIPLLNGTALVYPLRVLDGKAKLGHIFVGVLTIMIIIANLMMGTKLHLDVVVSVLRKPFAPMIGFFCQFLLMPLIAYCLAIALFEPCGYHSLALGLFTMGCAPGGGASNFWTVLFEGNVDLSVTMTFLSTTLALGMLPLWMFTLGRQFIAPDEADISAMDSLTTANLTAYGSSTPNIRIPFKNIFYSLLVLVLPLVVGILINRFLPKVGEFIQKALRPFILLIILFICTFGVYANLYMFDLMTWRVLVVGLMLPWLGFLFGCVISLLMRQPKANVIAIAIETGVQNSGIAIVLLKASFVPPDGDMASVIPVIVSIFTPVPLLLIFGFLYGRKCLQGKGKGPHEESDDNSDEPVKKVGNGEVKITYNSSSNDVGPMALGSGPGAESRALLLANNNDSAVRLETQLPPV